MSARQDVWRELSPLLDQAFELDDGEREQWLASLSVSRPDLERELRVLLAQDRRLEHDKTPSATPFATLRSAQPSLAGTLVGAWQLERLLGQGGMGAVWLAARRDGRFEGHAAVKLLNPSLLSSGGESRFRMEGSVLAKLSHPNIARLLDAGVSAAEFPFLVLEFVEGERIDRHCERVKLPVIARVRLFQQVLSAVSHAHVNLIVHRDIKPSNILVTNDGVVKLLDFGIATILDSPMRDHESSASSDTRLALTPEYAAPEQMRGEAVTTATDVYALGVLLYLLLGGRHPTTDAPRNLDALTRGLFEKTPTPLGFGDLDLVLLKALQKQPSERYQTVAAMSDDLSRWLAHEPVSAHADTITYRATKFVRRHRVSMTAGVLTALALLMATEISVQQSREARRQRDAAVFERKRADAQLEFQGLLLSEVGDKPFTMREILDKGRAVVEQQYRGDAPYLSSLLVQLSRPYIELGDTKIPAILLARADSMATAQHDSSRMADAKCNRADVMRVEGHADEAGRLLDSADAILQRHPDPRAQVGCLMLRAVRADEMNDTKTQASAIRRAIAIQDSLGETTGETYITALGGLGDAYMSENRLRDAQRAYQHVIALMDSTGRGGMMTSVIQRHSLGLMFEKAGESDSAERVLHDVVVRAAKGDPSGRAPVQPLVHYAQAAFVQGQYDSASKYFAQLADQGVRDSSRYWEARGTFGLARSLLHLGVRDQAQRAARRFEHAVATLKNRRTDDQYLDARALDAEFALTAGDPARAARLLDDVLRSGGYDTGKRVRQMHAALLLAAEAAVQLRDGRKALSLAGDARTIATRDSLTDVRSLYVGECYLMESRAYLTLADSAHARASLSRGLTALTAGGGLNHYRTVQARALSQQLSTGRSGAP